MQIVLNLQFCDCKLQTIEMLMVRLKNANCYLQTVPNVEFCSLTFININYNLRNISNILFNLRRFG